MSLQIVFHPSREAAKDGLCCGTHPLFSYPRALAVDVDSTAGSSSSQRKNGGDKQRRQMARVAPLVAVSSNEGEQDSEWNYHVYDKYGNQKPCKG